jgi:hypothetical protein
MEIIIRLGLSLTLAVLSSISAMAQPDLIRPVAVRLLSESPDLQNYRTKLYLVKEAVQIGMDLGWWRLQGLSSTLGSFSPEIQVEVKSHEGFSYITLNRPIHIQVTVTGIAGDRNSGIREVQFTWRYGDPPRLLRNVAIEGGAGVAIFKHFDDGWRLAQVLVNHSDRPYPRTEDERARFAQSVESAKQLNRTADVSRRSRLKESMNDFRVIHEFRGAAKEQYRSRETIRVARILGSHLVATNQSGMGFAFYWLGSINSVVFNAGFKEMYVNDGCGHSGPILIPQSMHTQFVQALNEAQAAWRRRYSDVVSSFGNLCDPRTLALLNDPNAVAMRAGTAYKDHPLWFDDSQPAMIAPQEAAPPLSDVEAIAMISKILIGDVSIPLGRFKVVKEGVNWRGGFIHAETWAWAQAAQKARLGLSVESDPPTGTGNIDQMREVRILKEGDPNNVTTPERESIFRFRAGYISPPMINGNEEKKSGSETYRLIRYSYEVEWDSNVVPHYEELTKSRRERSRKAAILYKWNSEQKLWQATRGVSGNASEPLSMEPILSFLSGTR